MAEIPLTAGESTNTEQRNDETVGLRDSLGHLDRLIGHDHALSERPHVGQHRATMIREVTEDGATWPKRAGTDFPSRDATTCLDMVSASRKSPAA